MGQTICAGSREKCIYKIENPNTPALFGYKSNTENELKLITQFKHCSMYRKRDIDVKKKIKRLKRKISRLEQQL